MNWEGEQILSTNQDFHSQLGPAWTTPSQGRRGVSTGTVSQTVLTPHTFIGLNGLTGLQTRPCQYVNNSSLGYLTDMIVWSLRGSSLMFGFKENILQL